MRIRFKTVQTFRRLYIYNMSIYIYDNKFSYNTPTTEFHTVLQGITEIMLVPGQKFASDHLKQ